MAAHLRDMRANHSRKSGLRQRLKKPVPAWLLIVVLVLGIVAGIYGTGLLSQVAGSKRQSAPDFTIGVSPASMVVAQGNLSTFIVSLSSLNSFARSVDLNLTISPSVASSSPAINSSSVSLFTGTATATLTIPIPGTTPTGTYTVNIMGTSSSLIHHASAFMQVVSSPPPDFQMSANPYSMNVTRGSTVTSTITLTSTGGFSGAVSLTTSISPNGAGSPTVTLNPYKVTLFSGGSGSVLLTISTSSTNTPGTYYVGVQGINGNLSHAITVTVVVL